MISCFTDLKNKEVVNLKDGAKLGYVDDVKINICNAQIISLVILGRCRWFGLFGREEDIVIPWDKIEVFGEDTILVCIKIECEKKAKEDGFFSKIFK